MTSDHSAGVEEVINCVVVGDSGVGKTYLTRAHACNATYRPDNVLKIHQSSVWAIDNYQHDSEILERSVRSIDGYQVSLRIWDTFGCHGHDRIFAYKESMLQVPLPGVTMDTFGALKEYLYTGAAPSLSGVDCIRLIELANRLCLRQLVNMIEALVVEELTTYQKEEKLKAAIKLLEPSELYNARQLSRFCQFILSTNFLYVRQHLWSQFLQLRQDNRDLICNNQWPPAWYLKDMETYNNDTESSARDESRYPNNKNVGCLSFLSIVKM